MGSRPFLRCLLLLLTALACVHAGPRASDAATVDVLATGDDGTFFVAEESASTGGAHQLALYRANEPRRVVSVAPALPAARALSSWTFDDHALSLTTSREKGLGGARLLVVHARDGIADVVVATTTTDLDAAPIGFRAGDRVALVVGAALVFVDLRRAQAMLADAAGLARHDAHDYADAAALFAKAVQIDPTYADGAYNEACALAREGKTSEAAEKLLVALGLDPVVLRDHAKTDPDLEQVVKLSNVADALLRLPR